VINLSLQTSMAVDPAGRILDALHNEIATAKDDAETIRFLEATRAARKDIEAIGLLDASGKILALAPSDERRIGDDLSGQPGFIRAVASGKTAYSSTFLSAFDRRITVAIFKSYGDRVGLVLLDLADLSRSIDQVRLSPKDQTAVVDETGRFIANSDIRNVRERRYAPIVAEGGLKSVSVRGEKEFAMAAGIPGLGWRALYFRNAAESRNMFGWLATSLCFIAAATMMLAIALAHAIRNLVKRPFDAIFEQLEGFGEGDYGKRLDGDYPIELAGVAGAFNRMAEKVERREVELQKSEGRYRSLFFGGEVPSLLVGMRDGRIVDANDAAVAYYGWNREELLARAVGDIDPMPRDEVRKIIAIITEKGNFHVPSRQGWIEAGCRSLRDQPGDRRRKIHLSPRVRHHRSSPRRGPGPAGPRAQDSPPQGDPPQGQEQPPNRGEPLLSAGGGGHRAGDTRHPHDEPG
jgi:PAS domain-containing protein